MGIATLEKVRWFLKNIELPYDSEILLLGIYPREMKTGTQILYVNVHRSTIHNSRKVETT